MQFEWKASWYLYSEEYSFRAALDWSSQWKVTILGTYISFSNPELSKWWISDGSAKVPCGTQSSQDWQVFLVPTAYYLLLPSGAVYGSAWCLVPDQYLLGTVHWCPVVPTAWRCLMPCRGAAQCPVLMPAAAVNSLPISSVSFQILCYLEIFVHFIQLSLRVCFLRMLHLQFWVCWILDMKKWNSFPIKLRLACGQEQCKLNVHMIWKKLE